MDFNLSHHAHLLIGGKETHDELLVVIEKHHRIPVQANPDFFHATYEVFTIDDARSLKESASIRPVSPEGKKIFVLTTNSVTIEAQNALLKLLEEPAEYVRFFLIIPSAHVLLPTVKSRLVILSSLSEKNKSDAHISKEAESFLSSTPAKRLEIVKKLVEDISKEKKTKKDAIDFLDAIQRAVYEKGDVRLLKSSLEAIETARKYIHDRAPSVKMLLEYVALNIGE